MSNVSFNSAFSKFFYSAGLNLMWPFLSECHQQAGPLEMSHGTGWDGTARIAFPMGPMGQ